MVKFAAKLKLLKQKLCSWNKEVFGNIHQTAKEVEAEMIKLEDVFDSSPRENNKKTCAWLSKNSMKLEIEELY